MAIASEQKICALYLNSATPEELAALPKMGPKRAAAVVRRRPFRDWNDLKAVACLGERTIKNLKDYGVVLD